MSKITLEDFLSSWVIPPRIWSIINRKNLEGTVNEEPDEETIRRLELLSRNDRYKGRFNGKRCFIICNGPSVSKQDLLYLKDEITFSVSSGYHHPLYLEYQPLFHCVPQITYNVMKEEDVIQWFTEMHEKTGEAELFLSISEEEIIRENNLFPNRKINYLWFTGHLHTSLIDDDIDISKQIPGVQSVAILCLILAIYMGFKQIYLLGTEHDDFKSSEYNYFFDRSLLKIKDMYICDEGQYKISRYDQFHSLALLWKQYRLLKELSISNNVEIYNATAGGELDEFPRVDYEKLFKNND